MSRSRRRQPTPSPGLRAGSYTGAMGPSPKAPSPQQWIAEVDDARRDDVRRLHDLVREVAPELEPTTRFGMLGYGPIHYRYASGREGEWVKIGIAVNAKSISLHCCAADDEGYVAERFRDRLPKADIGRSCVRFKRLDDLEDEALRDLLRETVAAGWGM